VQFYFILSGSNEELTTASESVWLSFTGSIGESLRVGINPYGAYLVEFYDSDGKMVSRGNELELSSCGKTERANWQCKVSFIKVKFANEPVI